MKRIKLIKHPLISLTKILTLLLSFIVFSSLVGCYFDLAEIEKQLPGLIEKIEEGELGLDPIQSGGEIRITSIMAPWEGFAKISQGNFAPNTGDYSHFQNTSIQYAIDISKNIPDTNPTSEDLNFKVLAVADGKVVRVVRTHIKGDGDNGYGNFVLIKHNENLYSFYGHLRENSVFVLNKQGVKKGDVLGFAGSTGKSTGIHLHFHILNEWNPDAPNSMKSVPITNFAILENSQELLLNDTSPGQLDYTIDGGDFNNSKIEDKIIESNNVSNPYEFTSEFSLVNEVNKQYYVKINYYEISSAIYSTNSKEYDVIPFIDTFFGFKSKDHFYFQVSREGLIDEDPYYFSKNLNIVANNLYLSEDSSKKGFLKITFSSPINETKISIIVRDCVIVTFEFNESNSLPVEIIEIE